MTYLIVSLINDHHRRRQLRARVRLYRARTTPGLTGAVARPVRCLTHVIAGGVDRHPAGANSRGFPPPWRPPGVLAALIVSSSRTCLRSALRMARACGCGLTGGALTLLSDVATWLTSYPPGPRTAGPACETRPPPVARRRPSASPKRCRGRQARATALGEPAGQRPWPSGS